MTASDDEFYQLIEQYNDEFNRIREKYGDELDQGYGSDPLKR